MDKFDLDQNAFRGRDDDGSESAATWKAAANTNWSQNVDENFRCRFVVASSGGLAGSEGFQLQRQLNAGTWGDVTTSSTVVKSVLSTQFADADATTQQVGSGTFVAGEMDENAGATGSISFANPDETEVEYVIQIISGDVVDADTVNLRLVKTSDGGVLKTYTNSPAITVSEGGGITGTVAVTQEDQTSTASGHLTYSGSVAVTQDSETASASGVLKYSGSSATTQDDQTSTASGTLRYTGTVGVTQEDQTSTASGTYTPPPTTGTVAVTQANQIATADGWIEITGTISVTQTDQTASASGVLGYTGTVGVTQDIQTSTASGVLGYSGSLAETQAAQTATASGNLAYTGTLAETQDAQTATASGTYTGGGAVTGTLAITQASQTLATTARFRLGITAGGHVRFFRLGTILALVPTGSVSGRGWNSGEGWEEVSELFSFDALDASAASTEEAMSTVASAWAANKGASATVLKTAIHSALHEAGFQSVSGGDLT